MKRGHEFDAGYMMGHNFAAQQDSSCPEPTLPNRPSKGDIAFLSGWKRGYADARRAIDAQARAMQK